MSKYYVSVSDIIEILKISKNKEAAAREAVKALHILAQLRNPDVRDEKGNRLNAHAFARWRYEREQELFDALVQLLQTIE
jgi:hypothetical protein